MNTVVKIVPDESREETLVRMRQELAQHMKRVERDRLWNGLTSRGFKNAAINSPNL